MKKEIYYCDRCNIEIKEKPLDSMPTNPEIRMLVFLNGEWHMAHLCPKCKESFTYWWNREDSE